MASPYLIVFLAAFGARVWFGFCNNHTALFTAGDASEYLREARALFDTFNLSPQFAWKSFLALIGQLNPSQTSALMEQYEPLKELAKQSGPVYPLFLITGYLLIGHVPDNVSLTGPLLIQFFLSSITCALVALLGTRTFNSKIGFLAGILAAFYPGFVVNSARLLSETFACFWICLVTLLAIEVLVNGRLRYSILLGFSTAVLQTTRSALVLVTAVVFSALVYKRSKQSILLAAAGLTFVILPVMALQKLSTGNSTFVPDRCGSYNLFLGFNSSSQGWLAYPYPGMEMLTKCGIAAVIEDQIKRKPLDLALLMSDKPIRLFKFPWNDFRTPIGNISSVAQVTFHQVCLIFFVIGVCTSFLPVTRQRTDHKDATKTRLFLLSIIGLHFVYLFFISLARYAITAMPFILIFSAAGISFLAQCLKNNETRRTALSFIGCTTLAFGIISRQTTQLSVFLPGCNFLVAAILGTAIKFVAFGITAYLLINLASKTSGKTREPIILTLIVCTLVLPFTVFPLRAHGRLSEWSVKLDQNRSSIEQTIKLPLDISKEIESRDCFLIIDCKDWRTIGQFANVFVNNKQIMTTPIPLMPLVQNLDDFRRLGEEQRYLEFERIFSMMLAPVGASNLDLRQWYLLKIPTELLSPRGSANTRSVNVKIQRQPGFNPTIFGSYIQKRNQAIIPSVRSFSWEKCLYGVEDPAGLNDPRFDEKVEVLDVDDQGKDLSNSFGFQTGTYNIRLVVAPRAKKLGTTHNLELLGDGGSFMREVTANKLPSYSSESIWLVSFHGIIHSKLSDDIDVPVLIAAGLTGKKTDSSFEEYFSPWVPSSLKLRPGENRISFSYPVKPHALGGPINSIFMSVKRGGRSESNSLFRVNDVNTAPIPATSLTWSQFDLKINELNSNPIGQGFEIY